MWFWLKKMRRWGACFGLVLAVAVVPLPAVAQQVIISAFGDSLSAGYGLPPGTGFVPVLESALKERGHNVKVVNAALSGDTSSGGVARTDWVLRERPHIVILELGANDMLRGLPTEHLYANLEMIIQKVQKTGAVVILAGMKAPLNTGIFYSRRFAAVYEDLADEYDLPFMEFFLEGVALNPDLNLIDGSHPNAAGVRVIVENILPLVIETIEDL